MAGIPRDPGGTAPHVTQPAGRRDEGAADRPGWGDAPPPAPPGLHVVTPGPQVGPHRLVQRLRGGRLGRGGVARGLRARGLTVPRRVTRATSDLTETGMQLVRLVREGFSNRQIAAAMHYSRKTIEVYLSRVYAKTGCASRLDLIRAVDTGGVRLERNQAPSRSFTSPAGGAGGG